MSDRALGAVLLVASTAGFVYYTVWTLALPFVDADQPLHRLFPPRHWAVIVPAYAIAVRPRALLSHAPRAAAHARARQMVIALVAAYAAKVLLLPERKKQARAPAESTALFCA